MRRIALLGMGSIGRAIIEHWQTHPPEAAKLVAVCAREHQLSTIGDLPDGAVLSTDLNQVLAMGADIVIEAAGQQAVAEAGGIALSAGSSLLLLSVGALADAALADDLIGKASAGGGQIIIVPGALGGFDALLALREAGLDRVKYTSIKPPLAWEGTPADQQFPLRHLSEPTTIYRGNARNAARLYPKNANLAAAVALAGKGFDETEIELIADPAMVGNLGILEAWSETGTLKVEIAGRASPSNPKTSEIVASSVIAVLNNAQSLVRFA